MRDAAATRLDGVAFLLFFEIAGSSESCCHQAGSILAVAGRCANQHHDAGGAVAESSILLYSKSSIQYVVDSRQRRGEEEGERRSLVILRIQYGFLL